MKWLGFMALLAATPAMAMEPASANLTCGAGHIPLTVYTDHNGDTTITTGLMGEVHQSRGAWHGNTLEWDVDESVGNFHFSLDINSVQLVITPPAKYGEPLTDGTCREGL